MVKPPSPLRLHLMMLWSTNCLNSTPLRVFRSLRTSAATSVRSLNVSAFPLLLPSLALLPLSAVTLVASLSAAAPSLLALARSATRFHAAAPSLPALAMFAASSRTAFVQRRSVTSATSLSAFASLLLANKCS